MDVRDIYTARLLIGWTFKMSHNFSVFSLLTYFFKKDFADTYFDPSLATQTIDAVLCNCKLLCVPHH